MCLVCFNCSRAAVYLLTSSVVWYAYSPIASLTPSTWNTQMVPICIWCISQFDPHMLTDKIQIMHVKRTSVLGLGLLYFVKLSIWLNVDFVCISSVDDRGASVCVFVRSGPGNRGADTAGQSSIQAHEDTAASQHPCLCRWTGGEHWLRRAGKTYSSADSSSIMESSDSAIHCSSCNIGLAVRVIYLMK